MKRIDCLVQASEIGAGTRGSSLAYGALRVACNNKGSVFFDRFKPHWVEHRNELLFQYDSSPAAKNINGMREVYENQCKAVSNSLNEGAFPLVISSDHCSAGGTIAGIKQAFPDKRLGVIWVDAHADLHTPWTTPSGNMHGMPLATALAVNNESEARREPTSEIISNWDALKNTGGVAPKILPSDLIFFAVRSSEPEENALIESRSLRNYTVDELRERGLGQCLSEASELLKEVDILYLSFDVDSMDPDLVSKGTGTPVEHGLRPIEASQILNHFAHDQRLVCMETVEINPTLDEKKNLMAETAFDIIESFVSELEK
jgi:arginase